MLDLEFYVMTSHFTSISGNGWMHFTKLPNVIAQCVGASLITPSVGETYETIPHDAIYVLHFSSYLVHFFSM